MNTENTGTIITRAVGVALVIMGSSSMIGFIQFLESAEIAKSAMIAFLPCVVEAAAGLALVVCSRSIGRLLARGLTGEDELKL